VALALWMGIVGFGGGFSVVQRIRRIVVNEKRWMSEASFLEHFAVAGAVPGTASTNLVTMLGLRFGGLGTGALSAALFLAPSAALMVVLGAEYGRIRSLAALGPFLDGMGYATIGVVAAVAFDMRRAAVKKPVQAVIAVTAAVALSLRVANLLEVVALSGLVGTFALRPTLPPPGSIPPASALDPSETFPPASSTLRSLLVPPALVATGGSLALLLVFARIGVATFGGGFAMISPIEHEVVTVRGWLDEATFNDAIVLGQVTPGPVAIASTFIGYRVGGLGGAAAATIGMFGPPFALSIVAARSLAAFRENAVVRGFLLGVSPAVVGVIAAAAVALWRTSPRTPLAGGLAFAVFVVLARFPKLSPLLPLALGGLLNTVLH
jgi:chromate transporter